MTQNNIKKAVDCWLKTANHDYDTMKALFETKRYSDSLFFGHIILEKVLKGLVVMYTKESAPYVHNLVKLHDIAKLNLSKQEIDLLYEVNEFNIRSRYPEEKLKFYKMCTKQYTKDYLIKIDKLYQKLCQMLEGGKLKK